MDEWLKGPLTSAAFGWRLERSDGVTLGFTSHDRDVVHNGLVLRASPGLKPTTIFESLGLENGGLDVTGALTSDAICGEDLAAGRWDGAYLEIFLFDWHEPGAGRRLLACGELGSISYSGDAFEAELLGLKQVFDRPVAPQTSPSCRASFCDAACGLNRQQFRHVAMIDRIEGNRIHFAGTTSFEADIFAYGQLRLLGGAGCGLSLDILENDNISVLVPFQPVGGITAGVSAELIEGCDRQISTCAIRFGNSINFRGEPYLPGNDLLPRYPGVS